MQDLTGKASVPMFSIWSVERESCLEKAVQCKIFYFHTSFAGTHLSREQDIYKISHHLSYVPKAMEIIPEHKHLVDAAMHREVLGHCRYWGQLNEACKTQLFSPVCINLAVAAAVF